MCSSQSKQRDFSSSPYRESAPGPEEFELVADGAVRLEQLGEYPVADAAFRTVFPPLKSRVTPNLLFSGLATAIIEVDICDPRELFCSIVVILSKRTESRLCI